MATNKEKSIISRRTIAVLFVAVILGFGALLWWLSSGHLFRLFETSGQIATRQRALLVFTMLLSLVVLVPTYAMLYIFAWRYREGHKKDYKPKWDNSTTLEIIWWAIPIIIIGILAVVTYKTTHSLDPYKPLASSKKPVQVQVIALNWKWLFIYPEEKVASVNEFAIPVNRPVELTLTSDGPMGSFWLPELAGQIYVMSGMSTKLHIDAHKAGSFDGVNSNITGKGYADMRFKAKAMDEDAYQDWLSTAANEGKSLDAVALTKLRKNSVANPVVYYSLQKTDAFDSLLNEYMGHGTPHKMPLNKDGAVENNLPHVSEHEMEGM